MPRIPLTLTPKHTHAPTYAHTQTRAFTCTPSHAHAHTHAHWCTHEETHMQALMHVHIRSRTFNKVLVVRIAWHVH